MENIIRLHTYQGHQDQYHRNQAKRTYQRAIHRTN